MQRRQRPRERQKNNRLNRQNSNFARASRFFVDFFAVTARLGREMPYFTFCGGRKQATSLLDKLRSPAPSDYQFIRL